MLSKLDITPVSFHNRKCLVMKLTQCTYKFKIMAYYEVSFQSIRFLPKYGTVYFVLQIVTVFDLSS